MHLYSAILFQESPLNIRRSLAIDVALRRLGITPEDVVACLAEFKLGSLRDDGLDILDKVLPSTQEVRFVNKRPSNGGNILLSFRFIKLDSFHIIQFDN